MINEGCVAEKSVEINGRIKQATGHVYNDLFSFSSSVARHTLPMPFFTIQTSHISINLISSCQEFIKEDSGAPKKRMSSTLVERDDFSYMNGKFPQRCLLTIFFACIIYQSNRNQMKIRIMLSVGR